MWRLASILVLVVVGVLMAPVLWLVLCGLPILLLVQGCQCYRKRQPFALS